MSRAPILLTAALALSLTVGCGPQFDPSSEIKSLRVLAVKKDKPYAQPGETVKLDMLWHDAKASRPVERLFVGGCINPPGDLYYACFEQLADLASKGELPVTPGDSFEVTLPPDIISGREGDVAPGLKPYGVAIVFFAVCAGHVTLDTSIQPDPQGSSGLPLLCLDDDGKALDSDDFVVGYTSIYSFDGIGNQNPGFTLEGGAASFMVAGQSVPADCVGEACLEHGDSEAEPEPVDDIDCTSEMGKTRCITACADDGDVSCPSILVAPVIDEAVEEDPYTSELLGTPTGEQMWVNYYVDHGGISEVRLVNDATTGWNSEYRGELRAPKEPGLLKVWAVVHDNRGGMDFTRITLKVE